MRRPGTLMNFRRMVLATTGPSWSSPIDASQRTMLWATLASWVATFSIHCGSRPDLVDSGAGSARHYAKVISSLAAA